MRGVDSEKSVASLKLSDIAWKLDIDPALLDSLLIVLLVASRRSNLDDIS